MPALWRRLYLYDPQTVLVGGQARVIASGFSTHPVSATAQIAAIDAMLVSGAAGGEARGYWADEIPFEAIQGLPGVPADRFLRTGAGSALEALTAAQLASAVNRAAYRVEAVGGTANARTITTGLDLSELPVGIKFRARFPATNTAGMTFNIDDLGAIAARPPREDMALPAGFIRTTCDVELYYDGSKIIVHRPEERVTVAAGTFIRYETGKIEAQLAPATAVKQTNSVMRVTAGLPAGFSTPPRKWSATFSVGSGDYPVQDNRGRFVPYGNSSSSTTAVAFDLFLIAGQAAFADGATIANLILSFEGTWY